MKKPTRHWAATHWMGRFVAISVATMTLLGAAMSGAEDMAGDPGAAMPAAPAAVDAGGQAPAGDSDGRPARQHRPAKHRTPAQNIEDSVRRLTRALDLDSGQQDKLRQILLDQHRQMSMLRAGTAPAHGDVIGAQLGIYDQTKARIRAMLNDDQKQKYPADIPRDQLGPAQADLQHWLGLQESKRRQSAPEDQ